MADLGPNTERRFAYAFARSAVISKKAAANFLGRDEKTLDALSEAKIVRAVRKGSRRAYTERDAIVQRYLVPFGMPDRALRELATSLGDASPALIKELCEGPKRRIVLAPVLDLDPTKDATVSRVLASCHPHPKLGKPKLCARGEFHSAVELLPWPLPRATDIPAEDDSPPPADSPADNIVTLRRP